MGHKIREMFLVLIRNFSVRIKAKAAKKRRINNNRVTVIKYDGLGDFILFLDSAKELKKMFPNKTITLSCSPEAKQIAELTDFFDEIICFVKEDFKISRLAMTARRAKLLDCEFLLHPTVSRDYYSEVLVSFIKASVKYSVYNEHSFPEKINRWFEKQYDRIFDVGKYKMALQQNANFLRALGYKDFKSTIPVLPINRIKCNLCLPNDFFVLFVGGSKWDKVWLADRFCEVAKWIMQETGWTCVVCGTQSDKPMEDYFSNNGLKFVSYIGKTSISELVFIISRSRFVFGNDTSAIHMAVATNVMSLCVRSAVSLKRFYPYVVDFMNENASLPIAVGVNPKCQGCALDGEFCSCKRNPIIPGKMNCICEVSTEMVITSLRTFFSKRT